MDYLRSLELTLFLTEDLDVVAMRTVLGHLKPLVLERDRPLLLVPAIVEERNTETQSTAFSS